MTFVDGIGGAFICSNDPKRLAEWYRDYLGFRFDAGGADTYYQVFWALAAIEPSRKVDTTFSIMRAKTPLPERPRETPEPDDMYGDQPYMINFRLRDLDATLAHLAGLGVHPIRREDYEYGRFAWIRDADGNRVELYQPR